MMIEAIAQVAGWLVNVSHNFKVLAIMSLVEGVSITRQIKPGDQVLLEATLNRSTDKGSECSGTVWRNEEVMVRVERILFYHYLVPSSEAIERVKAYFAYLSGNYLVGS
jgi:3-hydroxymyristoyl/3-hydroxydecanoyl-(acyl carrier protein) dehydratase